MHKHPAPSAQFDGIAHLAEWGVIRARGEDAASFLHGQMTQDFIQLGEHQARLAGYCSAKGRLLATFIAWRAGPQDILLACSADLLAATLKRLSMFVLRAKCQLSDASAQVELFGLAGTSASTWLGQAAPPSTWECRHQQAAQVIRLPDSGSGDDSNGESTPRFLWAAERDLPLPPLPPLGIDAWNWLEVRSGVARVVAATAEQFVPQMLNLELIGGVNFQKGCYPGQEIVARSQYRGTLKRRTHLFESAGSLAAGMEVFHSADPAQPAGMVVLAASLPADRHCALVELKMAALQDGTLHAGSRDGALLTWAQLPYSLATEAA
jgi:folate-binding protein YgfZ